MRSRMSSEKRGGIYAERDRSCSLVAMCFKPVISDTCFARGIRGRLTGPAAGELCGSGRQAVQPSIRSEAGANPLYGTGDILNRRRVLTRKAVRLPGSAYARPRPGGSGVPESVGVLVGGSAGTRRGTSPT